MTIVLEGGYNLDNIAKATNNLLELLNGDFFPTPNNTLIIAKKKMKNNLRLIPNFYKNAV